MLVTIKTGNNFYWFQFGLSQFRCEYGTRTSEPDSVRGLNLLMIKICLKWCENVEFQGKKKLKISHLFKHKMHYLYVQCKVFRQRPQKKHFNIYIFIFIHSSYFPHVCNKIEMFCNCDCDSDSDSDSVFEMVK